MSCRPWAGHHLLHVFWPGNQPCLPCLCVQAPDSETLERFLGRLPLMFKVVILSPHGYFGQTNVLGMPDTGGQVGWREVLSKDNYVLVMSSAARLTARQACLTGCCQDG